MTPEDYQLDINLIKDRYHALDLTLEQAEQIFRFEEDKKSYSEKYFFSFWEEMQYDLSIFRQILTIGQLEVYEKDMVENTMRYEQLLIEQDADKANEISYNQKMITYYEDVFLPELTQDLFIFSIPKLHRDHVKIEFLKSEYKIFLNERRRKILSEHFRHNRLFKPNELQAALLRHKLCYLWPDYSSFKHLADEATVAVIDYINMKIKIFPDQTEELLSKKLEDRRVFNIGNFKNHYANTNGWHVVTDHSTEIEKREHRVMTLLLFDKFYYGHNLLF